MDIRSIIEEAVKKTILNVLKEEIGQQNGENVNLKELVNGNLEMTLTPAGKAEIEEVITGIASQMQHSMGDDVDLNNIQLNDDVLYDLLDAQGTNGFLGNGWVLTTADRMGQLSEAPILGYDIEIDGDGDYKIEPDSQVWYYEPYQVISPAMELYKHGSIIWNRVKFDEA